MNGSQSALETLLTGEEKRLMHQQSATVLAKYGSLRKELEALQSAVATHEERIAKLLRSAKKRLDPFYDKFDPTAKAGIEDLQMFRFIEQIGGSLINFISNSDNHLQMIEMYGDMLLPVLTKKNVELSEIVLAEDGGSNLILTVSAEYQGTVLYFEKLLASIYLGTRSEYKKLRRKFLGGTVQEQDNDSVEDQLLMSFFGARPPRRENTGPAVALIDDNCVLTQLLIDLSDSLPRYYEKITPILKRNKLTGKTKTVKTLDDGEIEDQAGTLIAISNPQYWMYVNNPGELTRAILEITKAFQSEYASIASALHALVMKANIEHEEKRRIIEDPTALVKQYNRINFLSIRPSAEDIAPRTKMDADLAVARTKLFVHLKETLDNLSGMLHTDPGTEEYAISRVKEAIELKEAMDDIQRTEAQKNLKRNIADDNEFYVGKSDGRLGTLGSEREPAPKIAYDDVIGASFITAKQHVEEVIKVASHPHLMRLSAPRGNVKSNLLFIGPYGCHAEGQMLLMYDGSLKAVEDIAVGDRLMGPDSTARTVLSLHRGTEEMAEIVPTKGAPWVVNRSHILSLMKTQHRTKENGVRSYQRIADPVDVSVADYINWSENQKTIHPLYRVGVEFNNQDSLAIVDVIDPYQLGMMLGDGSMNNKTAVTSVAPEIINEVHAMAAGYGLHVVPDNITYHMSAERGQVNPIRTELRSLDLFGCTSGNKFIPMAYKTASRHNRFQLLAGILDTDGYLHDNCFDYVSKSEKLANDVAFVVRSLGLAAYISPCVKHSQNGTPGQYYRVSISGETQLIPTKCSHKQASVRVQEKNVLHVGFTINPLPAEDFYGFIVDGDHRYLLDDFTVTHNCGKTEIARAIGGDKRIIGFNVATADMLTAYMHESVKNVKRMYDCAKDLRKGSRYTKPVAILIDEFDRLFDYGQGVHQAYDGGRMTGILQEMMDGVVDYEGVFLVGMTNVPKTIPEAVLRRFKYVDVVGQLNQEERIKLFKMFLTRGLPIHDSVTEEDYAKWAEMLNHAPGDVIGKVTDEIHFKFMHELVTADAKMVAGLEKTLSKKLRDREHKKQDFDFLKKALAKHKTIGASDITTALETVIAQPQVKMQITKAKQTYKDAADIMKGLSAIGESDHGFHGVKKSVVWSDK